MAARNSLQAYANDEAAQSRWFQAASRAERGNCSGKDRFREMRARSRGATRQSARTAFYRDVAAGRGGRDDHLSLDKVQPAQVEELQKALGRVAEKLSTRRSQ